MYNKTLHREHRNKTERAIYDACDFDQAIDKLTQKPPRKKSHYKMAVHRIISKTGKPFCTPRGLVNPIKLDISNLTKKDKEN